MSIAVHSGRSHCRESAADQEIVDATGECRAIGGEKGHRPRDLRRLSRPTQRNPADGRDELQLRRLLADAAICVIHPVAASVSIQPGDTMFTRTPLGASALASPLL